MDLQTALNSKLHSVMTGDATLATAMGGSVALYPVWAKSDAPMPYICHRFDLRPNDGEWVTRSGTYVVDIFSSSNNFAEAMAIKDRIITLVDHQSWDISSGGTVYVRGLRLDLQTEGFVTEETEEVWHYVMQFNVRLIRRGEISNIVTRS